MRFHSLKKINYAFLASLWLSLLAPLSWYILAKGHSHVHYHMNYLLWYVPFLILVAGYLGFSFQFYWRGIQKFARFVIIGGMTLLVFTIPLYMYKHYSLKKNLISQSTHIVSVPERNLDVYIYRNKLLYVSRSCDSTIEEAFFLHVYPFDNAHLDKENVKYNIPFNNFDFRWYQVKQLRIDPLLKSLFSQTVLFKYNVCIAFRDLPGYPIKSIRTGQYAQYKGDIRYWDSYLDIPMFPDISGLDLVDLSDANWEKSIHRFSNAFFIENNLNIRNSIQIGTILKFNDGEERNIVGLEYHENYINVYVNGSKLDPNLTGYPNKVKIVR